MILTIANQKGGSGKTTLAINSAVKFLEKSKRVLLLDTDSQKNCEGFSNIREDESKNEQNLPFFTLSNRTGDITQSLKQSVEVYDDIIIDTKGSDCTESRKAMLYADVVVIPTTPSQLDYDVLQVFLSRLAEIKDVNDKLKIFVVMNRINPNPFLTKELRDFKQGLESLAKDFGITDLHICETYLNERISYKRAISEGKGITEYTDPKAKLEFENLFNEILA